MSEFKVTPSPVDTPSEPGKAPPRLREATPDERRVLALLVAAQRRAAEGGKPMLTWAEADHLLAEKLGWPEGKGFELLRGCQKAGWVRGRLNTKRSTQVHPAVGRALAAKEPLLWVPRSQRKQWWAAS